jgi:hypothetical protein
MNFNYVFLEPVSPKAYRRPECDLPIITGLYEIEPDEECNIGRLCYEVKYDDGHITYIMKNEVDQGMYRFVVQ